MRVYFNCYIWGEGYSMKYMEYPDGPLEEFGIKSGKMPDWERKVLTGTGALMFYGTIAGQNFGCVRMIESGKFDENGRDCYYNIAFSEHIDGEGMVPLIMGYAKDHYHEFCQDVIHALVYKGGDYQVKQNALTEMYAHAKEAGVCLKCREGAGFLLPESSADYFFVNTQIPAEKDKIQIVEDTRSKVSVKPAGLQKTKEEMKLFFYCYTPSMGYVMKQIDPDTGAVLSEGKEAGERMPEHAFALATRSGARAALYQTASGQGLMIKNIRSEKADQYGNQKHMTIAIEVAKEKSLMLKQFAAWAMLDHKKFSEALTDCVEVYHGIKGYTVNVEKLKALFVPFEKRIYQVRKKYQNVWERLVTADETKKFQCLALEVSLDYFVRSTEIKVPREQIALMIREEKIDQWKEDPLYLEFSPEMYQAQELDAVMSDVSQVLELEDEWMMELETETEKESVEKQEINQPEDADMEEEVLELEEMDAPMPEDVDPRGIKGEDFIDLLELKGFKEAVIVGGIVLISTVIFLIRRFL